MDSKEIVRNARAFAETLSAQMVDVKPADFDFGDRDDWVFIDAIRCSECKQIIVLGPEHGWVDEDGKPVAIPAEFADQTDWASQALEAWMTERGNMPCPNSDEHSGGLGAEGPMMNYQYPLPDRWFGEEEIALLIDLPLCIVTLDGDESQFLALTGGGMDLSWEICAGYIALGLLPPAHFRDLPRMAGMTLTERNARVVAAMERSCTILQGWFERGRQDAAAMYDYLIEEAAQR